MTAGPFFLKAPRLNGLMTAKQLERKHFVALGFKAPMVDKLRAGKVGASVSDAIRIADWLDVCLKYLWGAPSRYDHFAENYPLVAVYASLDAFLELTDEGRSVPRDIRDVLEEIARTPGAPVRRALWLGTWKTLVAGVQHGELRGAALERMAAASGPTAIPSRSADSSPTQSRPTG